MFCMTESVAILWIRPNFYLGLWFRLHDNYMCFCYKRFFWVNLQTFVSFFKVICDLGQNFFLHSLSLLLIIFSVCRRDGGQFFT